MATLTAPAEFTITRPRAFNRSGPIRWIWAHSNKYWWIIVMLVLGAIGNAALAGVVPLLTRNAFDAMLAPVPDTSVLLPLALILGLSQVIRGALQLGRNFGAELLAQRLERDIRDELYISLLGKSMTFHSLQPVGDTMARATNDVREINLMFSPGVNLVVGSFLFLVISTLYAPRFYPTLVIVPFVFTVLYVLSLWRYLRNMAPITDEVRGSFGDMNTHLAETLDGVEVVKGSAQEGAEVDRFVHNARRVRNAFVRQGDLEARFLPNLLLGLAYAAGLTQALLLFRQGLLTTGGVVGYFGLLRMLEFPTFTSSFAFTQISLGISGARRILELMKRENNLDQNLLGQDQPIRGEIEFRNVSFVYPDSHTPDVAQSDGHPGEPVLANISFRVKPGQTVAIVGQTGAGKTSLVKLVNRTYDATEGQVLVDGVDVRDWNLATLRSQVSMIEQDIFLFSRSIASNIAFGKPGASKDDVEYAARSAQADEFIRGFENSYETVVGERGVTLSGGQRQRLALARAFLTDPHVLILDDSTSAIDSATEDKIQRAISAAAQGRTTLIITHRLSQIRWADLIIVLRKGRIAAIGSHEELMRTSEAYGRIFRE
jgi:ATP-binding cassette, subfamily B, bacterial